MSPQAELVEFFSLPFVSPAGAAEDDESPQPESEPVPDRPAPHVWSPQPESDDLAFVSPELRGVDCAFQNPVGSIVDTEDSDCLLPEAVVDDAPHPE